MERRESVGGGSSIVNIMVRVQAQLALRALERLNVALDKVAVSGAEAGATLDAIAGAARGYTAALGGASAEAANLAKALSQINRSGATVAKNLLEIGAGAELAQAGMADLTTSARALSAVMGPLAAQSAVVANSLQMIARAANTSALQTARADAIREQSAARTAGIIQASQAREEAAREKAAAEAQIAAARVAAAEAREQAAATAASAAIVRAEEAKQAARYKTMAAAATTAAAIAAAEARAARAAEAAAMAQERAAARVAAAQQAAAAGAMLGAGGQIDRASRDLQKMGSRAQWVGRQLMVNISGPLALITAGATKFYYDQEKAFTYLAKVYDGAAEDLGDFGGQIGKVTEALNMMSSYFGVNREEVYTVAEAWASLGMTGGALAKAVQNTFEASLLGNMDLEKATNGLIAIQAQFQIGMKDSTQALAEMNAIANQGPTELGGLIDAMARTGAVAHAAGLTVSETAGMIEELAPSTGTAVQAGNGLKSMIASISAPTAKTAAWLEKLGINVARWGEEAVPVKERIGELADMYDRLTDVGKTEFAAEVAGKWQYGRLTQLLDMFNEEQGEYQKAIRASGEATGESTKAMEVYEKELARLMDSDFIKFNQAWQMIKNSMADAIKPAIPAILQFVQILGAMFKWFSDLSPTTRKWILTFAAIAIVLGPIIMLMSTMVLLLGVAGIAFARGIPVVLGFGKALLWVLSGGKLFQANFITAALTRIVGAFAVARGAILGIWSTLWVGQGRVAAGGAAANSGIIQRFLAWVATAYTTASTRIAGVWAALWASQARVSVAGALANSAFVQRFLAAVSAMYVAASTRIAGIWAALWVTQGRVAAGGAAANSGLIQRFLAFMATMYVTVAGRIAAMWAAMWVTMTKISIAGAAAAGKGAVMALVRALVVPIVSAIGSAVAAIAAFVGLPVWVVAAIIAAVVAAGVAIYKFRDQIGAAIKASAKWFATLPSAIARTLRAALDVVIRFAKAIRDWLMRAFNPWVRNSPSLVDNVRSGTAAISQAYGDMANSVIRDVERAQRATEALGNSAAGQLIAQNEERQYQEQRGKVAQIAPAALPQLDEWRASQKQLEADIEQVNAAIKQQERVIAGWQARIDEADRHIESLNDELERLQEAADATSDALAAAQDRLQEYENANIAGEGAMSDAIFENEMAQKRLRLEIMKLEETTGPIEDIRDKYQALQGDIDNLRGKQAELRAAGAGSDILSTYDKMIADLERQQGELASTDVSKIEEAQKQLEELERRGEKLNLEQSLQFDPLNRQIEKLSSNMKEMPFDQIVAGIQRERAEVDRLTALHEQQNVAIEAQQDKIKAATKARDAMNDSMEAEQKKLEELNQLQSYLQENLQSVTGAMDDTVSAATELISANEEAARAAEEAAEKAKIEKDKLDELGKSAEDAGAALDYMFDNDIEPPGLPPVEEMDIDGMMADLENKLNEELAAIELDFNPFDEGFWGDLWRDIVVGIGRWIGGNDVAAEFEKAFIEGSGGIDWWYVMTGQRGGWSAVWRAIVVGIGWAVGGKDVAEELERGLTAGSGGVNWWKILTGSDGAGDLWHDIVIGLATWIGGKDVAQEIENLFVEGSGGVNWWKVLTGSDADIGTVFADIGRKIKEGLEGGLSEAFGNFFDWITDRIPIVREIKKYLGIESPSTVFAQIGRDILDGLKNGLVERAETVLQWFRDLPGNIVSAIGDLGGIIGGVFAGALVWVRDNLPGWFSGARQFFVDLPGNVVTAIGDLAGWVGDKFAGALRWVQDNLPGWFTGARQWFVDLPGNVVGAIGDLAGWVGGKFSTALSWVRDNLPGWASGVMQWFIDLPGNIVGALGDAKTWLVQTGKDVLDGLFEGMGGFIERLKRWVADKVPSAIRGPVESALGIASPSRVFMKIGDQIGQGLIVGLDSAREEVRVAAQTLANQVATVAVPQLGGQADFTRSVTPAGPAPGGKATAAAEAMPKQMQEAVTEVEDILAQHGVVQQGQLTTQATQLWNTYQGMKQSAIQQFTDMANGQIQITANRDGILVQGQASFNGTTISGTASLKDNVVALNGQMSNDVVNITAGLQTNVSNLFNQLGSNVNKTSYDTSVYQGQVWSATRDNLNTLSANTNQLVSGNFTNMASNLNNTFNNGIRPVFDAFAPMLSTTEGWFAQTVDNIGSMWTQIQPKTADPSRFVINEVYNGGIRQAWNKVNGWLGLPPLDEFIAPFATGGSLSRATDVTRGGRLAGPPNGDRKLFRGNGGEYVLTRPMVNTIGFSNLERMRHQTNAGRRFAAQEGAPSTIPGFALGGPVDTSLWNAAKTAFPNATLNSAHRPGDSGFHGRAQAVDLGGPMQQIADWIFATYPDSAQLIWGPGPLLYNVGGTKITDQAQLRNQVYAADLPGHYDHVHWASSGPITSDGKMISDAAGSVGGGYVSMLSRVEKEYRSVMDAVKAKIPGGIPGTVGQYPAKGYEKFDTEVWKFLKGKAEAYDAAATAAMGNTPWDISAGVEQWRPTVHQALDMVGQPRTHDQITLRRMQQESGGNPNAINNWDSNAAAGTPSKGLMQVIDPTFQAHKYPGYDNIWAPLDNILASMRYALATYGSLPAAYNRAGGYDDGGWLMPGFQSTFNGTAKPEPILTSEQWAQIKMLARGTAGFVKNIGKAVQWGVGAIFGPNPISEWIKNMIDRWKNPPGGGGPGGGGPGGGGPGGGTNPPVPPKQFWADAEAQMKTWTPDLAAPIEGLEGVVANLPRKVDEVVVPEWPPVPTIPEEGIKAAASAAAAEAATQATAPSAEQLAQAAQDMEQAAQTTGNASAQLSNGAAKISAAGDGWSASLEYVDGKLVGNLQAGGLTASGTYQDGKLTANAQYAGEQISGDVTIDALVSQYGAQVNGVEANVVSAARSAQLNVTTDANGNITATATTPNGTVTANATVAPGGDTVTINIANLEVKATSNADIDAFISQLKAAAGR